MKTNFILMLFAVAGLFLSSCERHTTVRPSGTITERDHQITGYSEVEVSHAFNVYVKFADHGESIVVEANDNLHPYIEVEKKSSTLCIGLRENTNIRGTATQNVYITTSNIDAFEASGASEIILEDDWETAKAYINLSGASHFEAYLLADELRADLSGASDLVLSGVCEYFQADISGASYAGDSNFSCKWFDGELSGASEAVLHIEERIDIEASGASSLHYSGDPSIHQLEISGASEVTRL